MSNLPWSSALLALVVLVVIVLGLSIHIALVVARSGQNPLTGVLLAILVPVIGPLVWALIAFVRTRSKGLSDAYDPNSTTRTPSILLAIAALAMGVAVLLPWARVEGQVDGRFEVGHYLFPLDTGIGAIALLTSAAVLILGAALSGRAAHRRASIAVALVGAAWLLVSLEVLIVATAVSSTGTIVAGMSGHNIEGRITATGAVWTTMLAAVCALSAAVILGFKADPSAHPHAPAVPPAGATAPTVQPDSVAATSAGWAPAGLPVESDDYGDGF